MISYRPSNVAPATIEAWACMKQLAGRGKVNLGKPATSDTAWHGLSIDRELEGRIWAFGPVGRRRTPPRSLAPHRPLDVARLAEDFDILESRIIDRPTSIGLDREHVGVPGVPDDVVQPVHVPRVDRLA